MHEESLFADRLNPVQLEAVETLKGPLLILAGAGSGKTRVLTHRVANLIATGEASPSQILCVTFTNKAAREMEARTTNLLESLEIPVFEPMWISTFHSICARILREDIHLLGYQPFFGIYDSSDQLSQIKRVMAQLGINDKVFPAKSIQASINGAKMLGLSPDDVGRKGSIYIDDRGIEVYKLYEQEMKKSNSLDFSDLLLKTYELWTTHPEVLERYRDKFQFIMVDEYQDTNHIQYKLVKALASGHRNLCVVGDEDQSIYSWRGADIRNILDFEEDFPEVKTVKLEENYRSSQTIVKAATAVIKNNSQRKDKTLFTSNDLGDKIVVREETNEHDEARFVANQVRLMVQQSEYGYKDMAVFYRTNAQSRVIEDQLRSNHIPYRIVGGVKFYERMEVKDVLSYMKLLLNPTDDIACKRVINVPTRGIGKTTVEKIDDLAMTIGKPFYEAISDAIQQKLVHAGAVKKLRSFVELIERLRGIAESHNLSDLYLAILDQTEYVIKLKEENTTESLARVDNLEELNNAISQFEKEREAEASLQSFLEEMALVSDADQVQDDEHTVTMMTLHISKGLEYPVVFIVGMEQGLFPSGRSLGENNEDGLEEERRLAYVGMTRAEKKLFLTHAKTRRVWGAEQMNPPSEFLQEIPEEFVDRQSAVAGLGRFGSRFVDNYDASQSFRSQPRQRNQQREHVQDFPDYENFSDSGGDGAFQKGERVRHPTFGTGSIWSVEGSGDTQKVGVMFPGNRLNKFVVKYARLEKV